MFRTNIAAKKVYKKISYAKIFLNLDFVENDLKDYLTDSDGHLSTNNGDMMEKAKRDVMGE